MIWTALAGSRTISPNPKTNPNPNPNQGAILLGGNCPDRAYVDHITSNFFKAFSHKFYLFILECPNPYRNTKYCA